MKDSPFQNVMAPRAPESLKQIVMDGCAEAMSKPSRTNVAWFDLFLKAGAFVSVLLFGVTCWSSFAVDNTLIPGARFSKFDSPTPSVKSGKSSSLLVMRRTKAWF